MNYDFYRTFVSLAETKNFSKTAENLNIVQSTVSNRITELEKYLEVELFLRTNKSVKLTTAGENFLPYVKRIIAIEEEGLKLIRKSSNKIALNIGVTHSLYSSHVKNITKSFMKNNPDVSIKIIINHSSDILVMLQDNIIDIAIVYMEPKSNKYICTNIFQDDIILVAKNSYKFKNEIELEDLKNLPVLYVDLGDDFEKWLSEHMQDKIDYILSVDQTVELIEYLEESLGYAFIQRFLVNDLINSNVLKEVHIKDIPLASLSGYVVTNKNSYKNEIVSKFSDMCLGFNQ